MNIAAENEHPKDSAENEPRGPVTVRAVPGAEHLRDRHEYVRRVGGADSTLGPTTLAHSRICAFAHSSGRINEKFGSISGRTHQH